MLVLCLTNETTLCSIFLRLLEHLYKSDHTHKIWMIRANNIVPFQYLCACAFIIWVEEMFTIFVFQRDTLNMQAKVNIKWISWEKR